MNKIILMGRLTRDPEVRYSTGENPTAVARFGMAVDRRFKKAGDQAEADFFNCTAFGKQGEFVEKYLRKGTKILMAGRIQNDNYTNKDGQKVYGFQIIAEEIEFAESKASSNPGGGEAAATPTALPEAPDTGFLDIPGLIEDEGLPFN